jgi:hypothetical protein
MYGRLVFESGLPPDYVLDRMPFYEINIALEYSYLKNKERWEQARMICYVIAQSNSTKRLKATDIMTFHWEKKEKVDTTVSDEDAKRLREKLKQYVKENSK